MASLLTRVKRAWNIFLNRDPTVEYSYDLGQSFSYRPDRPRLSSRNERSIINSVYNRISIDVSAIDIKHVRLDDDGRYIETIDSGLNNCLTVEANIDQTARAFKQDAALSLLDEGSIVIAPVDTDSDPDATGSYKVDSIRVGRVVQWFPRHVRIEVYNDRTGLKEEVTVPKSMVAIVENPFYSVMNEPNSTLQRLIRKLNLLDVIDEQSGSGKLDLIIQLPYLIRGETRQKQAEDRRKKIEEQLAGSKYGIAYIDGTEHITQLNRAVENNLMTQIEYLTSMLLGQLGITQSVLDGTADAKVMQNYFNQTVEPIISAIVDEMKRKFLIKTARTQGQSIMFFRDPFRLVPVTDIAEIADKMTRNEIMTSNEIRQIAGMKPSKDPEADKLRNKNLNATTTEPQEVVAEDENTEKGIQNGEV